MKISKETLNLLKNFSSINTNLTIKTGNKVTTISPHKNILAEAVIQEEFPVEFGVYDLTEFLGSLSLFDSPDLAFNDRYVLIKEAKNSVKFYAANASILTPVPQIKQFPAVDVEFELTSVMISHIQKVSGVLHSPDLSIIGEDGAIKLHVGDKGNPTGNTFEAVVGDTDKTFNAKLKIENLRLMNSDYVVTIGGKKISRFQAKSLPLSYFIALELDSVFNFQS
jgi:hypothetical protein